MMEDSLLNNSTKLIAIGMIATLSACGGSGSDPIEEICVDPVCDDNDDDNDDDGFDPTIRDPLALAPSISAQNLLARTDLANAARSGRVANVLQIAGGGDYRGHLEADLRGDTPLADELHGTINLNVRFSNDQITGNVSNLNAALDGVPVERLTGTLQLTGEAGGVAGTFDAALQSSGVRGQVNFDEVQDLDITADLNGIFRDRPNGNAVFNTFDNAAIVTGEVNNLSISGDGVGNTGSGTFYVDEID